MQRVKNKNILRWYWTPCNIYKDKRILNYDYNHDFKNFPPSYFPTKKNLYNSTREIKSIVGARFETRDPQIAMLPFN